MKEKMAVLRNCSKIQKAFSFIEQDQDHTLEQQIELALIPAYSNHEEKKARRFREMIEEMGYKAEQDEVFNTFTCIPGPEGSPVVMMSAHLDTVFPPDTELKLRREGSRIYLPGICDDTRGCAEILAILRAMKAAEIRPACTLLIGGNVGEEGVGNFRGMRHIFLEKKRKVDAFLSIDGTGDYLTYGGVSDVQMRITFRGPGGHSMGAYGLVNPVHCMGRAIGRIAEERAPLDPFTIYNVSTVSGGTGVTSIASECSMTMDIRSADAAVMTAFRDKCIAIARDCAEEEYARWEKERAYACADGKTPKFDPEARITVEVEELSGSLGAVQSEDCEIVRIVKAAYESCGIQPIMRTLASTDSNIPLSLGIPAVTVSRGGSCGNIHDISEWFDPTDAWKGTQRNFMSLLALTGVEGVCPPLISRTQTLMQDD